MALRFRKSIRLAPGIRINMGLRGASLGLGPRGASVSIGKRGVYSNLGLPGTGLSTRTKLAGGTQIRRSSPQPAFFQESQTIDAAVRVGINDDGTMVITDPEGNPLPDDWIDIAKRQHPDAIRNLFHNKCNEINGQIEAIGNLHYDTPNASIPPIFCNIDYSEPRPEAPVKREPSFFEKLFKSKRERIDSENRIAMRQHESLITSWNEAVSTHEAEQQQKREKIEKLIYVDLDAMESHLEETLQDIAWPRETIISAELLNDGKIVFLDVDLPEIEDMPDRTAAVPQRGMKLTVKSMSPTAVQKLYMRHLHSIGFRLIGETFAALPQSTQVVLSGYSQRRDKITGNLSDEYLYSVRVNRHDWQAINFSPKGLEALDIVEALAAFDLRRAMSKTGIFKPIEPFSPESQ